MMDVRGRSVPRPSGEAFIGQFVLFIDSRGPELLSGNSPLKLQPRALEYVANRLDSLRELQRLKSSDPMGFISGASKDLADYKRLETVQNFLERVEHLKLHSGAKGVRDPTPVNLSPFRTLASLELRGCDVSSTCVRGLAGVRPVLQRLICQDTLETLRHLLAPLHEEKRGSNPANCEPWPKLTHLSCQYNNISEIDWSLRLLPSLQLLDLSRNHLTKVANLSLVPTLVCLDLSHNRLSSLGEITDCCPHLEKLILQGNGLRNLRGIEKLECLTVLDVKWNLIAGLGEAVRAARLPKLGELGLEGNPMSVSQTYRVNVLSCFLRQGGDFILDGVKASEQERRRSKRVRVTEMGEVLPVNLSDRRLIRPPPSFLRNVWQLLTARWAPERSRRPSTSGLSDAYSVDRATPKKHHHKPVRRVVNIADSEEDSEASLGAICLDRSSTPPGKTYDSMRRAANSPVPGKIDIARRSAHVRADVYRLPSEGLMSLPGPSNITYSVV
ncbi:hypothetical protein BSKO_14001 [Bryopsis sp. KO-2023]|nr:hypothetical protein BSKO_14001 [Bryopsis sp. KO-2023]